MNLQEVTVQLFQILDEERRYPTVQYVPVVSLLEDLPHLGLRQQMIGTTAQNALDANRSERPRTILRGGHRFEFRSQNYNLVVILLGRTEEQDRTKFLSAIAQRINHFPAVINTNPALAATLGFQTSDLPLVSEFLIRNGGKKILSDSLTSCRPSPGVLRMLKQLADTIAVSHPIFSDAEYSNLILAIGSVKNAASKLYFHVHTHGYTLGAQEWKFHGLNALHVSLAIERQCDELVELCRKAQFLSLESQLAENINLEINQDKYEIEGFLQKLGFSGPLLKALAEAERLNVPGATELELKSSMGHLRSFLENLHAEAVTQIQRTTEGPLPANSKWGTGLSYLSANDFLTKQEEGFAAGLYTLISDEAVHPLIAKREYARLSRNVVIEYGLLFLRKFEQFFAGHSGKE
jgi:hypothetical protein